MTVFTHCMKKMILALVVLAAAFNTRAQQAALPPMGWMSWNLLADKVNEKEVKAMADAMISSGMAAAGYQYIFIDDGWQGGRDNKNNLIPDPAKFPSGVPALAQYLHSRGLKLGMYSDAAQLTCAGYTASLGFEEQDAKTLAAWGVDYLKYDYCNAPEDSATAKIRYRKMADALRSSGRDIALGICEWGQRQPWHWAAAAGGLLWRTTADIRDKWCKRPQEEAGAGILDVLDINAGLAAYAGPGRWNDADMLVVGLYGRKGPSGDLGGTGCTDTEYRSQFSLWAMMNAPLYASNDLRAMNEPTRQILLNKEVIALNQDTLGKQAERMVNNNHWTLLLKPLSNGDYAIALLNRGDTRQPYTIRFSELGLKDTYDIRDLWQHAPAGKGNSWSGHVQAHETKLLRLSRRKAG